MRMHLLPTPTPPTRITRQQTSYFGSLLPALLPAVPVLYSHSSNCYRELPSFSHPQLPPNNRLHTDDFFERNDRIGEKRCKLSGGLILYST